MKYEFGSPALKVDTTELPTRRFSSFWKTTIFLSSLAVLVQVSFQLNQSSETLRVTGHQAVTQNITQSLGQAKLAVEFLDESIAAAILSDLINAGNLRSVSITDDFGRVLSSAKLELPAYRATDQLANLFGIELRQVQTHPLVLTPTKTGHLTAEVDLSNVFHALSRDAIISVLVSALTPIMLGFVLFNAGPLKLESAVRTLAKWASSDLTEKANNPPKGGQLHFREMGELGLLLSRVFRELDVQRKTVDAHQKEVQELAVRDPLTGAHNRRHLASLQDSKPDSNCILVLFVDIDDFKFVNDKRGHKIGDACLQILVRSINEVLIEKNLAKDFDLIRYGGDEFILIHFSKASIEDTRELVREVIKASLERLSLLQEPLGVDLEITGGFAVEDPENGNAADLIEDVVSAMSTLKESRKGKVVDLQLECGWHVASHRVIRRQIASCVSNDEIEFHYQPIISTKTEAIIGYEALARWKHPQLGMMHPKDFIGYFESGPLCGAAALMTVRVVVADIKRMRKKGMLVNGEFVSLNFSVPQLLTPGLIEALEHAVSDLEIDPTRLHIEVTETDDLQRNDVIGTLRAFRAIGLTLSLDDFGSGYSASGLNLLQLFNKLKFDRSLFSTNYDDQDRHLILFHINSLCRDLGVETICEGVETISQFKLAYDAGCYGVQGYLFGKPKEVSAYFLDLPPVSALANLVVMRSKSGPNLGSSLFVER